MMSGLLLRRLKSLAAVIKEGSRIILNRETGKAQRYLVSNDPDDHMHIDSDTVGVKV